MDNHFSESVLTLLLTAGWYPGRKVIPPIEAASPFTLFSRAEELLVEFGGLHIGKCGPGRDFATSDVEITVTGMNHLARELPEYEERFDVRLCPIGKYCHRHGYLLTDVIGRIYALSEIADDFRLFAATFSQALESLLLGCYVNE
jgi:hypothetical protein